jgi:hypothetical protein
MMLAVSLGILLDLVAKNKPNFEDKNEVKLREKVKQLHRAFSLYRHYHYWLFSTLDEVEEMCNIGDTNPLFFAVRMIDLYQECKTRPIKFKIDSYSIIDEGVELLDSSIMDNSFEKAEKLTDAIYQIVEQKDLTNERK